MVAATTEQPRQSAQKRKCIWDFRSFPAATSHHRCSGPRTFQHFNLNTLLASNFQLNNGPEPRYSYCNGQQQIKTSPPPLWHPHYEVSLSITNGNIDRWVTVPVHCAAHIVGMEADGLVGSATATLWFYLNTLLHLHHQHASSSLYFLQ